MMGTVRGSLLAAVLLLASPAPRSCSAPPACPHSCTCPTGALVNCSSSGLSIAPRHIQDSVAELDLSHNLLSAVTLHRPHLGLRGLWLSNNSIRRLSLCMGGGPGRLHVRGGSGSRPWNGRGCVSWAPTLQLLSVERNQLVQLPEGLNGSESLQVLQLSFNKITTLRAEDLQNLQQLRELHLQHNLIASLHPQIFQYLPRLKAQWVCRSLTSSQCDRRCLSIQKVWNQQAQVLRIINRVLDVSFNMLTSLHPSTYLSLRNIGAEVSLHGNRWQCDCNLRSLRRWMVHDSGRGLPSWSVVCAAPSTLSGTDLLELEDDDLNCFTTEHKLQLHQDVTIYSGSEILLSCSANDSFWWTSNTQRSGDRTNSHLFISDITEKDAGIYVCVSDNDKVVSVYNLHISKSRGATRNTRSLPRTSEQIIPKDSLNTLGQERNLRVTQNDFNLAVCLSVFITFLLAFILGVLTRPFIEILWRRVKEKRSSPATNPATTVHERQYDNEAFCDGDDPEEARNYRERRVTFSTVEYRQDNNVQYYDTLASGAHDSVNDDAVFDCEPPELEKRNGQSGTAAAGKTHSLKSAEPKGRRSSSSSSDSSASDKGKVSQKRRTAPKPPRQEADAVQQRSESSSTAKEVVVPQISIEGQSEIPGFSCEPFGDWSPHTSSTNLTDNTLCTGREEQFEFSDSNRSTPIRSSTPVGAFNKGGGIATSTSDIQRRDSSSSSSGSSLSDGEPSLYTVNPDPEEKRDTHGSKPARNAGHSVSSSSSDSDGQSEHTGGTKTRAERDADVKAKHVMLKKWQAVNLAVPARSESSAPAAPSASSDSDAEEEPADLGMRLAKGRVNKGIQFREDEIPSTNLDDTYSSSSSGGEEGEKGRAGTDATAFQESHTHNRGPETKWPVIECGNIPSVKRQLDIKANVEKMSPVKNDGQWEGQFSQSSHHPETQSPGKYLDIKATVAGSHSSSSSDSEDESKSEDKVSPTIIHSTETQGPTLDVEHIPRVTRCLDIKVLPQVSSSSSDSDTDDDSKTNRKTQWPLFDPQRTSGKRREDVNVPPRRSESSSSASSEDETTGRPGKVDIVGPLSPEPQTENPGQERRWPSINLDITPIKRRLDIKAPPDSSSSSESEDEMKGQVIKKQEVIQMETNPIEASKPHPQTQWPAVDLEQKVGITRRLDFKATTPASKDGTAVHIKQEQEKTNTTKVASETSSSSDEEDGKGENPHPKTQWPLLDLERTTGVKRRLDIKAASKISDSSSSSDSEDERAGHNAGSQTVSRDANTTWPAIDLQHIPQVKRRLDIKKSSPTPDSSSSSDSEDETKMERPGEVGAVRPPLVESTIGSHGVETKWPSVNLDQIPPLKRRLDVKAPSSHLDSTTQQTQGAKPETDSSSSSDDEDVITVNPDPKTQWPTVDLEQIPSIKRRLDIKARSPPSDSSSNSDSEDDAKGNQKTQWPLLDLQHTTGIKRRLDVKAPKPAPDSSSSSSSEDETTAHPGTKPGKVGIAAPQIQEQDLEKHPTKIEKLQAQTAWPAVDLEQTVGVKRRLDIKVTTPASTHRSISDSDNRSADQIKEQEQKKIHGARDASGSSSSSDDEDEKTVNPGPKTDWPLLDLERTSGIKRRLDVKATSRTSASSSSSDSEEETTDRAERRPVTTGIVGSQAKGPDVNTKWPALDLEHIPHIKRRLDIKASSRNIVEDKKEGTIKIVSEYAASSSDEEEISKDSKKARAASSSQSSSSTSDTESTVIEFRSLPESPVSPGATKDRLEKYAGSTEDMWGKQMLDNSGTKLEVNTELQSQWAAMNLGSSRFRKRLDITSHTKEEPPKLPSSPPPDSPSSSSSDDDSEVESSRTKGGVPQNKRPISTFLKTQDDPVNAVDGLRKDYSAVITERETNSPAGALRIRRSTDFKVSEKPSPAQPLQQHPSSCSENEDETTQQTRKQQGPPSVSQSSFNNNNTEIKQIGGRHEWEVPRLARRLDIKAPQRNSSSSSSSEDEKPKDESSQITYRRTVLQDSSLQSDAIPKLAVAEIVTTTVQETSLSGAGVRKKSFRSFTEVDLPPELQWTGVGRQLSGTSGNRVDIRGGASPTSWQEAPPALPQQPPPPDSSDSSSSESDDNTERHRGKANIAQTRQYSSLASRGDSFSSTFDRPPDRVDTSFRAPNDTSFSLLQDRRERKGLNALKAMSSERQIWETETQSISTSTSLNSDWGQQRGITFSHRRSEERTSLTKPSKSISSTSSASVRERRVADALFRYPSYRTHAIGDLKPPQDTAPPVPETSPPDEAVEITWRSRSNKTL